LLHVAEMKDSSEQQPYVRLVTDYGIAGASGVGIGGCAFLLGLSDAAGDRTALEILAVVTFGPLLIAALVAALRPRHRPPHEIGLLSASVASVRLRKPGWWKLDACAVAGLTTAFVLGGGSLLAPLAAVVIGGGSCALIAAAYAMAFEARRGVQLVRTARGSPRIGAVERPS
jgi:hypothetical protein